MKHFSFILRQKIMFLLGIFGLLVCSCSNDDEIISGDGRVATIRLEIPALEAMSRITEPTKEQENTIHTLRVIILSQGAESINEFFTKDQLTSNTITIDKVPVGHVQMYVIANEASLGKDYTDLSTLQKDVDQKTKKVHIHDTNREFFPKRGSVSEFPATGLPMEWMDKDKIIDLPSQTPQTINVNLVRAVAKLKIKMNNALKDPIVINGITFGEFFGDCLFLFHENKLDVPEDTKYVSMQYTDNIAIPIDGYSYATLTLYIYPSFAWKEGYKSPYTIGFTTQAGGNYLQQQFVNNWGALNSIARNTQININATLQADANIQINYEVVPWEENIVDVPSFN